MRNGYNLSIDIVISTQTEISLRQNYIPFSFKLRFPVVSLKGSTVTARFEK